MRNKKEKGISMIALIVTIIVLMILAVVSIQILRSDNGIINQANNAKKSKVASEEIESVKWAAAQATGDEENEAGILTNDKGKDLIDKYLKKYIDEKAEASDQLDYTIYQPGEVVEGKDIGLTNDVFVVKFKESENIYIIDTDGNVHKDTGGNISEEIAKRDGIILSNDTMEVNNETTHTITITTNAKDLKITNSNDSVIELTEKTDKQITFVAKAIGRSTITVETENGKKARCYVLVHQEPKKLTLDVTNIMFDLSENIKEHQVTATIDPNTTNYNTEITWTSSNPSVAEVNSSGNPDGQLKSTATIVAKSNGTATITASTPNGVTATCEVTVHTTPQSISISGTFELDLSTNNTEKLNIVYNPITSDYKKTIKWTSSNTNIAQIDQQGNVTGVANGKTTITAETENGKKATCEVIVHTTPKSITLNKSSLMLDISVNNTETLSVASYNPDTSDIKRGITWSSNNAGVATVDTLTGKVTAKSNGNATITARTENGKTATCEVTVHTSPTKITISGTATLDISGINGNKSEKLTVNYEPVTSDINKGITWETSNAGIATVSGGTITGISNGTVTIKATTQNGKSATYSVTVITSITNISLNKDSITLKPGESENIIATILPSTATENVTWVASNSNISISASGDNKSTCLIKGTNTGKVTLTAKNSSGTIKATCQVEVLGVAISATKSYYDLKARERYESECIMEDYTDTCTYIVDCDSIWDGVTGFWVPNPNCRYEDRPCTKTRCSGNYEDVYKGIDDGEVTISFQLSSYVPVNNLTLVKNGISAVRVGSIKVSNQSQAKYTIKLTTSSTYFRDGTLTLKYKDESIEYEIMTWNIRCR